MSSTNLILPTRLIKSIWSPERPKPFPDCSLSHYNQRDNKFNFAIFNKLSDDGFDAYLITK